MKFDKKVCCGTFHKTPGLKSSIKIPSKMFSNPQVEKITCFPRTAEINSYLIFINTTIFPDYIYSESVLCDRNIT